MIAAVTINFAGGAASASLVQIVVERGEFALGLNDGLATGSGCAFPNISIGSCSLSFATASGGIFDGTLTLGLQWSGPHPAILLSNLDPSPHGNPATITWPTAQGPETQILTPGTPLTLSGIAGS